MTADMIQVNSVSDMTLLCRVLRVIVRHICQDVQWQNCFWDKRGCPYGQPKCSKKIIFGCPWRFLVVLDNRTTTITNPGAHACDEHPPHMRLSVILGLPNKHRTIEWLFASLTLLRCFAMTQTIVY